MICMLKPKCSAVRRMNIFKVSEKPLNNDTILYKPFLSLYNNLYKLKLYIYNIYIYIYISVYITRLNLCLYDSHQQAKRGDFNL